MMRASLEIVNKQLKQVRHLATVTASKYSTRGFLLISIYRTIVKIISMWNSGREKEKAELSKMTILLMKLLSSTSGSQRDLRFRLLPK